MLNTSKPQDVLREHLSFLSHCNAGAHSPSLLTTADESLGRRPLLFLSFIVMLMFVTTLSFPSLAEAQPFAYITNSNSDNISVIDTSTNTVEATVDVGDGPQGVAVTPGGDFVYVTNSIDDTVSVINTATNDVVDTVTVGDGPVAFGIFIQQGSSDSDGDGVADDEDACPNSDLSSTVVIDGCNSGVENTLGTDGCTISDVIGQIADSSANHGKFVKGVSRLTNQLKKAGDITGSEKGAIQDCADQADIP